MFQYPQNVLFKHCDPAGIVFYPRYFEIINDCVEAFFEEIGFSFVDMHKKNAVPTAQISTQFLAPSRHGDQLTLSLEPTRIGGSSLDLHISASAGSQTRFIATSTLVYINANGRPERWPDPLRAALSQHLRRVK